MTMTRSTDGGQYIDLSIMLAADAEMIIQTSDLGGQPVLISSCPCCGRRVFNWATFEYEDLEEDLLHP